MQATLETTNTGAEAVKSDPHCSWPDCSRNVAAGDGYESRESRCVLQPVRIPFVIRTDYRT